MSLAHHIWKYRSLSCHAPLIGLLALGCSAQSDFADLDVDQQQGAVGAAPDPDPLAAGRGLTISSSSELTQQWYNEGVEGFDPALGTVQKLTTGSNSQQSYPRKMMFGDFDGDRKADMLQWYRGRLLITRLDWERSELAHLYLPSYFNRVLVGDFIGAGWDQVCVIDNALRCYGIDPQKDDQLRFWFKAVNPISSLEDVIVGNFDGDAPDELFLYQRETGAMRMLELGGESFTTHPDWTRGNLSRVASTGIQFRAGDLNGDGRTDLVARKSNGSLEFFGSSVPSPGHNTFWFHFNTVSNFVNSSENFFLARVDDDMKSELVVHNPTTGAIRAHAVSQPAGSPPEISHQLNTKTRVSANTSVAMAASHSFRNEPGAQTRDDVLTYDADNDILYNYEARHSVDQGLTYELDYSTYAPQNDQHWATPKQKNVLFLRCKFKNNAATPSDAEWQPFFDRLKDYYYDVTYGTVDMSSSELVSTWFQMNMTVADAEAQASATGEYPRTVAINECLRVSGKNAANYSSVFVLVNEGIDYGANGNRALLTPNHFNSWIGAHELGHTFGLADAYAVVKGKYHNAWDPMSAETEGWVHLTPFGMREGTGFNALNLRTLGAIPDYKYLLLDETSVQQTLRLSAVNRPGGRLLAIEGEGSDGTEYKLEYREPSGFDMNIPNAAVFFYVKGRLDDADNGVVSRPSTHERTPGERVTLGDLGTIDIVSIDTAKHYAELLFTPSN